MAEKCGNCGSTDVVAGAAWHICLNCRAKTNLDGTVESYEVDVELVQPSPSAQRLIAAGHGDNVEDGQQVGADAPSPPPAETDPEATTTSPLLADATGASPESTRETAEAAGQAQMAAPMQQVGDAFTGVGSPSNPTWPAQTSPEEAAQVPVERGVGPATPAPATGGDQMTTTATVGPEAQAVPDQAPVAAEAVGEPSTTPQEPPAPAEPGPTT